jgi:radical SAM superfamily enzyme with C-terminal helix-hairpin-helix motif
MEISRADHARNEEVLQSVKEERNILHRVNRRRLIGFVTSSVGTDSITRY